MQELLQLAKTKHTGALSSHRSGCLNRFAARYLWDTRLPKEILVTNQVSLVLQVRNPARCTSWARVQATPGSSRCELCS